MLDSRVLGRLHGIELGRHLYRVKQLNTVAHSFSHSDTVGRLVSGDHDQPAMRVVRWLEIENHPSATCAAA
jgi:hypothetical protein